MQIQLFVGGRAALSSRGCSVASRGVNWPLSYEYLKVKTRKIKIKKFISTNNNTISSTGNSKRFPNFGCAAADKIWISSFSSIFRNQIHSSSSLKIKDAIMTQLSAPKAPKKGEKCWRQQLSSKQRIEENARKSRVVKLLHFFFHSFIGVYVHRTLD